MSYEELTEKLNELTKYVKNRNESKKFKWTSSKLSAFDFCFQFIKVLFIMLLWNGFCVNQLGLPKITYWQALGMSLLVRFLRSRGSYMLTKQLKE